MNHTDFTKCFQQGCTFRYKTADIVTFSVQPIGELILTSGFLVACDPLIEPNLKEYFTQELKPGRYPVILSIASFQRIAEQRIACAMLRISNNPTVRWEIARRAVDTLISYQRENIPGYAVDSGTGGFMDLETAQVLHTMANSSSREKAPDTFKEYRNKLIVDRKRNEDWANIQVSDATQANVIAFSSGWGDGSYSSFWGYDAQGELTSLVTDFMLFGMGLTLVSVD